MGRRNAWPNQAVAMRQLDSEHRGLLHNMNVKVLFESWRYVQHSFTLNGAYIKLDLR